MLGALAEPFADEVPLGGLLFLFAGESSSISSRLALPDPLRAAVAARAAKGSALIGADVPPALTVA